MKKGVSHIVMFVGVLALFLGVTSIRVKAETIGGCILSDQYYSNYYKQDTFKELAVRFPTTGKTYYLNAAMLSGYQFVSGETYARVSNADDTSVKFYYFFGSYDYQYITFTEEGKYTIDWTIHYTCDGDTGTSTLSQTYWVTDMMIYLDGKGGTLAKRILSTKYGETVTLPQPQRAGYTFDGWEDGSGQYIGTTSWYCNRYNSTDGVRVTNLYARWKANTYTVTYDANGGNSPNTSKTVTYNTSYGTLPTPVRMGYDFTGWYTKKSGGTKVLSSSTVTTMANHTLYALWQPKSYIITYNANGGVVSDISKTVTYAGTYGVLPTPARTGYEFAGWFTEQNGGRKITSASTVDTADNQILYAHWYTDLPGKTTMQVKLKSADSVTLSWKKASGAKGYEVYRATSQNGTYKRFTAGNQTSYVDRKLASGKTYYYKIRAYKLAGSTKLYGSYSKPVKKKIIGRLVKPVLGKNNVYNKKNKTITLSWNRIRNADKIEIYVSTDKKKHWKKLKVVPAKQTRYVISAKKFNWEHAYYYKIKAQYTADGIKVYSEASNALGVGKVRKG